MCDDCTADIQKLLSERDQFQASNRSIVEITKVDGDDVYVEGVGKPAIHASHVGAVLHWLRDGHFVCGISSGTTAIKTLLKEGKLAECSRCANRASQIWAILNAMPDTRRDGTSGLAPNPSAR